MFINSLGYYIPEKRIYNDYFADLHKSTAEWYTKRTGISSRSRAESHETLDYMSIEAVKKAIPNLKYDIREVDLIIFASYSPDDTVATTGHIVQREFKIENAKTFYISSACSSGVNALEIIHSFFKTGIATKALLLCGDRNSTYSNDCDPQSGHLWGDCATAFFFSDTATCEDEAELVDISTRGLGHVGYGPEAVKLKPRTTGIEMPYGKDVFTQTCTYICSSTKDILNKNNYSISDLSYFIGHQANNRILQNVCETLKIPAEKSLSNIHELGNTGCGSSFLVFAQNYEQFKKNDLICLSVFGGGYSTGTCLFKF